MITTILITIWVTMSFSYCVKEWTNPYAGGSWLIDILFAPYFIIVDAIHEYKEWRKPAEYPNETQYPESYLPPDNGDICWQEGCEYVHRPTPNHAENPVAASFLTGWSSEDPATGSS